MQNISHFIPGFLLPREALTRNQRKKFRLFRSSFPGREERVQQRRGRESGGECYGGATEEEGDTLVLLRRIRGPRPQGRRQVRRHPPAVHLLEVFFFGFPLSYFLFIVVFDAWKNNSLMIF